MIKKFTVVAIVAGTLMAFSAPTLAVAAPSLTMPAGTLIAKGTGVTSVSTNTVVATPLGNITCEKLTQNGEVQENTGSSVQITEAAGKSSASTCRLGTNAVTVTSHIVKEIRILGFQAFFHTTLDVDLPGALTCHYETTSIGGLLTYTSGSSTYHTAGDLVGSPEVCGEEGEVSVSGDYSLSTTSGGGAIILD